MGTKKRIVIVGATSAMAEHCARLWVQRDSVELVLVGRDAVRVERIAADLRVRGSKSDIHVVVSDFLQPTAIGRTVDVIVAGGRVDIVLIAHGSLPTQTDCQIDLENCRTALEVNGVSPVLFAEAFAKHMERAGAGTLALIGSVAGDRGRKSNYVYGAAKGLVTRYAQGLQQRFAGTGVHVVLIKPGPTETPMTASLTAQGKKLASVEGVAKNIVDAIENNAATCYAPAKWQVIMGVIRHLPDFIFNRMDI